MQKLGMSAWKMGKLRHRAAPRLTQGHTVMVAESKLESRSSYSQLHAQSTRECCLSEKARLAAAGQPGIAHRLGRTKTETSESKNN